MPSLLDRKPPTLLGGPSGFLDTLRGLRKPGQIAGGAANYLRAQQGTGLEDRLRQASLLPVPVASDLAGLGADAMMYARDPESRTVGNAALTGLGLLPIIPAMTAYHGSPHKFDKFELSDKTIGTGEGAQAYGHGLYFAEDPKVAGTYAQSRAYRPSDDDLAEYYKPGNILDKGDYVDTIISYDPSTSVRSSLAAGSFERRRQHIDPPDRWPAATGRPGPGGEPRRVPRIHC